MDKRDTYFDFLRGVAIIMVMAIHSYCFSSEFLAYLNVIPSKIIRCAVPIFVAISGYFIGRKSFDEKGSYASFLKRQLPRVYIPMLIWSLPWALLFIKGGGSPLLITIRTVVGGMSIFYFVALIMQYYVLTPLIQRVNIKTGGGIPL